MLGGSSQGTGSEQYLPSGRGLPLLPHGSPLDLPAGVKTLYLFTHSRSSSVTDSISASEFTYSLEFVCYPKSALVVLLLICGHTQRGEKSESPDRCLLSQLRLNEATLCLLVSAHTVNKYPFWSLFSATFSIFLCFVCVCAISLFRMAPKANAEVLCSDLWRKYIC